MRIILFTTKPLHERGQETLARFQQLASIQRNLFPQPVEFRVEQIPLWDKYGYWRAMKNNWGMADLLTIEHDMLFTEADLAKMLLCSHPDCCALYRLRPTTTKGEVVDTFAQGYYTGLRCEDPKCDHEHVQLLTPEAGDNLPEEAFCNHPSFGFTKISLASQRRVRFEKPVEWQHLDTWIFSRIHQAFHLHEEIKHNH